MYLYKLTLSFIRIKPHVNNAELAVRLNLCAHRYEETMVNSIAFTTFVINVAMEGLCEKYGDEANLDRQNWVILKNKKYLGTLQRHHIQQVRK